MENVPEGIQDQLMSDGVELTFELLHHEERFHATVSLIAVTGSKEARDKGRFSFHPS